MTDADRPETESGAGGAPKDRYDLAILGGGLAGLSLGLQLGQALPDASIFIAEKRKGPAPLAAFKVGESTVEMSAYYSARPRAVRGERLADGGRRDHDLPEDVKIDPMKMSLHPDRWDEDGLFGGGGLTLAAARARTKGFDQMLLGSIAEPVSPLH